MSGSNFRGGRKLSPKPSAFESEIHPPHKPSGLCSGDFALPGANSRRREFIQSEKTGLYLSMPPKGRAHGWRCCLRLHFRADVQQRFVEVYLLWKGEASNEKKFIYRNGKAS